MGSVYLTFKKERNDLMCTEILDYIEIAHFAVNSNFGGRGASRTSVDLNNAATML